MVKTNQFIDDDNLTELSSLTHLLDRNEDDDTEDIPVLKHSPFYSELQFTDLISSHAGFSILDMNICNMPLLNLTNWKFSFKGLIVQTL